MSRKSYVCGTKGGKLQANFGQSLTAILQERQLAPGWWQRHYPVIYELVPYRPLAPNPETVEQAKEAARKGEGGTIEDVLEEKP